MIAKLLTEVFQKVSRDTTALQTVGLLSAMIFLVNYTFEVLVINGLYPAQHGLIGLMLLALCLWSIVEVGIIKHKQTPIPLTLLTIVLWSQLMVVLVRHTPQCLEALGVLAKTPDGSPVNLGMVAVFSPVYVVMMLLIAKLLINAFSNAEFMRAEQLADQLEVNRLAEEELRVSEERYRLIAERAGDVIWTVTKDGATTYVSPSVEHLIGFAPAELMRRPMASVVAPSSLKAADQAFSAATSRVQGGLPLGVVRGEFELWRKDQSTVWSETSLSALYDSEGRVTGLVGVTRDISERKHLEAGLVEARNAAVAANLAKSRFLATMSHEIRTPMTGVLGFAQMLAEPDITDAERVEYAGIVVDAGHRLLTIINGILDLSKIEADKLQLEQVALEPALVLAQTRALFTPTARAKGLSIEFLWKGPLHAAYLGDPHRVTQMLANLVSNALKFTRSGEIRIEASEVQWAESSVMLEFSVSDTGIGIAADKLNLLFREFSQVNAATTQNHGGSGLGLSIVRNLSELMGGTAGVESTVGVGSRFWFRIQVAPGPDLGRRTD
jgi:PAS domain S-box-containing protein